MNERREQPHAPTLSPTANGTSFGIILLTLLLVSVAITLLTFRATRAFAVELSTAIFRLNEFTTEGVLLTPTGWKPGKLAPDIPLTTLSGYHTSFREAAATLDVVYVAWDRCPICLEHFPSLQNAEATLASAGLKFALVVLLSTPGEIQDNPSAEIADMAVLQREYNWSFPVYTIDRQALLELNIQGTPTLLILRNGVFGDAFPVGSLDTMLDTAIALTR